MAPKHGRYLFEADNRNGYHTYAPDALQNIIKIDVDNELLPQLTQAHYLLGILNGILSCIPDINTLVYPLAHYEAVCSCNIEKQESLFNEHYGAEPRKISDEDAIRAYRDLLLSKEENLPEKHVLTSMMRNIHKRLLGSSNEAGQFRKTQIFTYPRVTTNTTPPCFNPPNQHEVTGALKELDEYFTTHYDYLPIIQVALIYYQLCIIQPFLSENGTTIRVCVNHLLVQKKLISHPLLCFSEFMPIYASEFRDSLRYVRDGWKGYETWISFFLRVVINAAEKTITMLNSLHQMRLSDMEKLQGSGKKLTPLVSSLYEHLWISPIIEAKSIKQLLKIRLLQMVGSQKMKSKFYE